MNTYNFNKNPVIQPPIIIQRKKFIPTPEIAQIILSYFIFNNFQDFNTWQQIAKTKSEYDYIEVKGQHQCKMQLKWEDKFIQPQIVIQIAQGKNKKDAKRKAMEKMIKDIMYQGYIGYGFKEDDFIKKLPRRRKQSSDDSASEEKNQESSHSISKIKQLLIEDKFAQALNHIQSDNVANIVFKISQIWHYALNKQDSKLCLQVILALKQQKIDEQIWQDSCEKQYNESIIEELYEKQFKEPLQEDLTEFLQFYQLQFPRQQIHPKVNSFNPRMLPSETVSSTNNLMQYFYPISKILSLGQKFRQQNKKKTKNQYFILPYEFDAPKFDDCNAVSYKIIEKLYDGILFYAQHYDFAIKALKLVNKMFDNIKIGKDGGNYYKLKKHLIVAEFLYLLKIKLDNSPLQIEGMITQTTGKSAYTTLTFTPKEPQQIILKKVSKKNNTNQFQEVLQIHQKQYVLLVSKLNPADRHIAYIKEVFPNIKFLSPSLPFQLNTPHPYTLYKLTNGKIYEKLSNALIQVSKHFLSVIEEQTYIFWQPPTYPHCQLIAELLTEWSQDNILVISSSIQQIHNQLVSMGFRSLKVAQKFDDKQITKYQVICSTPNAVCCDSLKNYAFDKIIIDDAHQVSEIISLLSISKGCKKLYLIGDIYQPRTKALSPYTKQYKMNISLMQRLINNGHSYSTYHSQSFKFIHSSILEYPNKFYYSNNLISSPIETPIVKGFPWPSNYRRLAFINCQAEKKSNVCLNIMLNTLQTGFIEFNQIYCIVQNQFQKYNLVRKMFQFFHQIDEKITINMVNNVVQVLDGCNTVERDLGIVITEQNWSFQSINGSFYYARRGLIFIGNIATLRSNIRWRQLISWAAQHRLILTK